MKCMMCAQTRPFDKATIFLAQQCPRGRPDKLDGEDPRWALSSRNELETNEACLDYKLSTKRETDEAQKRQERFKVRASTHEGERSSLDCGGGGTSPM